MTRQLDGDELDGITNAMRVWRTGTITSNYEGFEDDIDSLIAEVRQRRAGTRLPVLKDAGEIVGAYLDEHGFDGLYCDDCACVKGDLAPCGQIGLDCMPGYKGAATAEFDFVIYGDKEQAEESIREAREDEADDD